jgi:hypothetical protein
MTRVETTATVREDRTVTLKLPDHVLPGEHELVVLVDSHGSTEHAELPQESCDDYLVWEGGLLVYAGKLESDPMQTLRELYEERERRFLYGPWE